MKRYNKKILKESLNNKYKKIKISQIIKKINMKKMKMMKMVSQKS